MVESADGRRRNNTPVEKPPNKSSSLQRPKTDRTSEPLFRRSGGEIPVMNIPHGIDLFGDEVAEALRTQPAGENTKIEKEGIDIVDFGEKKKEE